MPTLQIQNHNFIYTKEQNSDLGKRSKKKEFISSGSIRQSSIDSILLLISDLQDTTVYKTNPCIMSGVITYITITNGTDTTKFTLHNTSDYIVLGIVSIINPYLPKDKKLYESIEEIKNEEECRTLLLDRGKKQKSDSTGAKQ